eukprot:scaffold433760_cov19-Prasinocladus_malaysianus.AAC.1
MVIQQQADIEAATKAVDRKKAEVGFASLHSQWIISCAMACCLLQILLARTTWDVKKIGNLRLNWCHSIP